MRRCAIVIAVFIGALGMSLSLNAQTPSERATESYFSKIKRDPEQLDRFLQAMPKGADLHIHLEGASMAERMIGYARNDDLYVNQQTFVVERSPGTHLAPLRDLSHHSSLYNATIDAWSMRNFLPMRIFGEGSAHDHFFSTFVKYFLIPARHRGEMLQEVAQRACNQNELYLELMIMPDNGESGMLGRTVAWPAPLGRLREELLKHGITDFATSMSRQLDGYEKKALPLLPWINNHQPRPCSDIKIRYLYEVLREQPAAQVFSQLLAGFELANRDARVLGINMVQAEDGNIAMRDYTLHMHMLAFLHRLYPKVHISLHAGELAPCLVPNSGLRFHIREAIELASAERIGHGVSIRYEAGVQQLLQEMAAKHIPVEINLSSNEAILNVRGKAHPIMLYLQNHVPVVLSTDDEGVLRTNLTEQYKKAVLNYDFSYATIKMLVRNSIHYSFLPGKSLWLDDHYRQFVPVCWSSLGSGFTSITCRRFLAAHEKARVQWALENQFIQFEHQFSKNPTSPNIQAASGT